MIARSFRNLRVVGGALTLTVSPEVALAAPGELYHQGTLLPAAFQVPLEGQVVQTLLLHTLKEEVNHHLDLGSSPPPVEDPGTPQMKNGTQWPLQGMFSWGRQVNQ